MSRYFIPLIVTNLCDLGRADAFALAVIPVLPSSIRRLYDGARASCDLVTWVLCARLIGQGTRIFRHAIALW